ncbi:MAG: UDP-N-acetylmuramoyl-tripeptide--D-alanyl-D-alanine ligase [Aquificae bacterium]|nr:UDP-N-acetylmuramoyl-tripeptide--D-alanyl-D-alanine ligase [Aquificota bacterium]
MKIKEILKISQGKLLNPSKDFLSQEISSFIIDSRKAKTNSFFIPLKGNNVDGHNFISDALKKGATGFFSQKKVQEKNGILVNDTYEALVKIAKYKRQKFSTVIGITGTSGKTTTKEILKLLLSQFSSVSATEGNYNNEIGLPLTLANAPDSKISILEMGAGKVGDIKYLSEIAEHDIGVLVSVGHGHTEKFGSFENVIQGKGEIFINPKYNVLPDNLLSFYKDILKDKRFLTFGLNGDIKISNIKLVKGGTEGIISFKNKQLKLIIPLYNKAIFFNIAAAVGVIDFLGEDPFKHIKVLENFSPPQGRGNIIKKKNIVFIDDTYNANPLSVENALKTLSELEGLKIAVLGDMLELGKYSKQLHEKIGEIIEKEKIDYAFFLGKNMKYAFQKTKKGFYFEEKDKLIKKLESFIKDKNAIVLVKGSRGMKMEEIIEYFNN